jgi:hypothetical protein
MSKQCRYPGQACLMDRFLYLFNILHPHHDLAVLYATYELWNVSDTTSHIMIE